MKKTLLALVLAALAGLPATAATVDVVSPSQVLLGDTFDINVAVHDLFTADPTATLIGFGFNFAYDPTVLQLVGGTADPTNWFDGPDDLLSNPAQILGLNFTGFTAGTPEPLALATLTFKAVAYGNTRFTISSDVNQFTGLVYDSGFVDLNGSGTVSVVPEPGALGLMGAGLVALAGLARRRRLSVRRAG